MIMVLQDQDDLTIPTLIRSCRSVVLSRLMVTVMATSCVYNELEINHQDGDTYNAEAGN